MTPRNEEVERQERDRTVRRNTIDGNLTQSKDERTVYPLQLEFNPYLIRYSIPPARSACPTALSS